MPRPIDIPVVAIGPGSQPQEADDLPAILEMPKGMYTHQIRDLPESEDVAHLEAALDLLEQLHEALQSHHVGDPVGRFDLMALDPANRALVYQLLGEGEVCITLDGATPLQIQESVLTGVWHHQRLDRDRQMIEEWLEVASIPRAVQEETFSGDRVVPLDLECLPDGVQNAPALIVELADRVAAYRPGMAPHVINLSLLPFTREDLILLGTTLGVGPTTILSRGYGNCRIGATAKDGVWWVKYFNSQDALILNTIEVVAVPEVAMAAQEDIEDSAHRLAEVLEVYR